MRALLTWIGRITTGLLTLAILAVVLVMILANIGPGRALIEAQTASLTGGMVRIQGLGGRFPDALRIGLVQVADAKGPYVAVRDVAFDWSPLRLLTGTAQVDSLTARSIDLSRLPEPSGASSSSGGSFELPIPVALRHLHVDQAIIGASVAGAAATFAVDGDGELQTLTQGTVRLTILRKDAPGRYEAAGTVKADHIQATVTLEEPARGLIATIAKLPDLGPVAIQASIDGPRDMLTTKGAVSAGPLTASASGTVDLTQMAADLTIHAHAPAMAPAASVSWQSVLIDAKVHGPFSQPDATGTLRIQDLAAAGARIGALTADVTGNEGQIEAHAVVADLHVPGPKPDLLAAAPVRIDATARLAATGRPVTVSVRHPLISIDGSAQTAGTPQGQTPQGQAHVVVADLAPLAAIGGVDIQGSTDLQLKAGMQGDAISVAVSGNVGITGGMAPVPALIGRDGSIDLAALMRGSDVTLQRLAVDGKALRVTAKGDLTDQVVTLDWGVKLADLTAIRPDLSGAVDATGHAAGKMGDMAATADITADIAARGFASGHIAARIEATGLPNDPRAAVTADGRLLDAPLSLALTGDRIGGTIHALIDHVTWKSLQAKGAISLPQGAMVPRGDLHLTMARLADLQPLIGQPIAGNLDASLDADEKAARLGVTLRDAALPGTASAGKAALNVTITDPSAHPVINGTFSADGVIAQAVQGASARIAARGPVDALALTVTADAPSVSGGAAKLTTAGTLDATGRTVALQTLEASWKQQVLRLLGPARIAFADGVSVDRLRLGFRQAVLSVSGSAGTKLDLTASLRDLPADVAAIAAPSLAADGVISADVRLTGTAERPEGTARLTADRVHLRQGAGQALPPASLTANATLQATRIQFESRLTAGQSHLMAAGTAPLSKAGSLDVKTEGRIDLAMLDPLLAAQGRRARGTVTLNAEVTGDAAAPRVSGTAVLANGDLADFASSAHITDLAATLQAAGDTITLAHFSGKAGPGTLGGSGSVSLAGDMPVDLHFTADNARPVASDLLTAFVNADLTVKGALKGDLQAGGTVLVRRADIRIPDSLPASIAVLPVRDPNAPPPPPPPTAAPSIIGLDLTINAPEQVFIRGRGLYAELGGTIHIKGTTARPLPDGGLQLRRGTLNVIGTTLNFTSGTIDFNGAGLADPALHFVATSVTATMTATMTVSGDVKNPKITLSSMPELPQDEILAQLLFNTSASKLSPLQLAQIAAALAQLSGATSGIGDPLEKLRTAFGLDRLSVGSDSSGKASLQAGRYIARGVYVGAQQSASGNGTQATVQVDLARGLKLTATAGSGTANATGSASSGDAASIGLTYQFEY